MSEEVENLKVLIHSTDPSQINQGFVLLESLDLTLEERAEVLDFSGKDVHLELESVNLSNANFSNSAIRGFLRNCNLSNANFTSAWVAVDLTSSNLDGADCTAAIFTDQTKFPDEKSLPTHIQSQLSDFYPVEQLSTAVNALRDAVKKMGGTWEPRYVDEFLSNPHKIRYYVESMAIASDVRTLEKRHKSRKLDYLISSIPSFLRENDVYLSGSFDDEGGYYFDNLCLGPQWTEKQSAYYSQEVSFVIVTYEYFYVNFDWQYIDQEEDPDAFLRWLYNKAENLLLDWLDEPEEWVKLSEWTEEQRAEFADHFTDNYEVGYCENLNNIRSIVSDAYPNSIGGEFAWTSWDTIKNNIN